MRKVALITGITGQDGSYLAEFLIEKGYEVRGDMTDSSSLIRIISDIHPTEIYNLAAQSHVKVSFDVPEYTAVPCGCWKPYASADWKRPAASTRHRPRNSSARCRKFPRRKPLRSIRVLRTG